MWTMLLMPLLNAFLRWLMDVRKGKIKRVSERDHRKASELMGRMNTCISTGMRAGIPMAKDEDADESY